MMKNFFKRNEMLIFFLLTYLLSWWFAPLSDGAQIPQGPALAAIILIGVTMGRAGLRKYWKLITNWHVNRWLIITPLIVVGYTSVAFVVNLWLGASLVETPHWLSLGVLIQLLLVGGQWEEFGWTGYALPKFQERFADLPNGEWRAALLLGVFRAIWHVPLVLYGNIYWFDALILSFALQIIIAWVYKQSGKNMLAVILLHFASNVMGAIMAPVFSGSDQVRYSVLFIALATMFAGVLVGSSQLKILRKTELRQ